MILLGTEGDAWLETARGTVFAIELGHVKIDLQAAGLFEDEELVPEADLAQVLIPVEDDK